MKDCHCLHNVIDMSGCMLREIKGKHEMHPLPLWMFNEKQLIEWLKQITILGTNDFF